MIRLLTDIASREAIYRSGELVQLDEAVERRLVESGQATPEGKPEVKRPAARKIQKKRIA